MRLIITPRAQAQIDNQIQFGVARHGKKQTSERTFARVEPFFAESLIAFPRTGTFLPSVGLYETIIPRTPFVIIYRIEEQQDLVRLLGFFHYAQDRTAYDPEE
jgi:plasmid stabilization system protein ParE